MTGQLIHWATVLGLDAGMRDLAEKRRKVAEQKLLDDVKDYLHRQVKSALHAASDAVRIVAEIGVWVRTQQHLISMCTTEDCADCATREALLASLGRLLPDLGTSGSTAGEVTDMGTRVTVQRGGDNEDDRELPGGGSSGNETETGGSDTGN